MRGVLVRLGASWREVASRAAYPSAVRHLLGQSLAASALLTGQIKFEGALSLEFKSSGDLRLLFAECTDNGRLRGLARHQPATFADSIDLAAQPGGTLAITIGNVESGRRYQGLVDLDRPDLAAALEGYFERSEQLPARLILAVNERTSAGLLLQKLPQEGGAGEVGDADGWNRACHLAATLGEHELLHLPAEEVLVRLFHQENVRVFEPSRLAFGCSCSADRVEGMLRALGADEAQAALDANEGIVEVTCEFCAAQYRFDPVDIEQVFSDKPVAPGSPSNH